MIIEAKLTKKIKVLVVLITTIMKGVLDAKDSSDTTQCKATLIQSSYPNLILQESSRDYTKKILSNVDYESLENCTKYIINKILLFTRFCVFSAWTLLI